MLVRHPDKYKERVSFYVSMLARMKFLVKEKSVDFISWGEDSSPGPRPLGSENRNELAFQ